MMQIRSAAVLLSAVMLLAGCSALSALNPFGSKAAPRNPPAELAAVNSTLNLRNAWSVGVGKAGEAAFTPAVAGDGVFAAGADGALARIDINSGREAWRVNTGTSLTAGVGSDGHTVAVGGTDGELLVYDARGQLRWKSQVSSEILSAPAVGQSLVVVRSIDNRIAAFDAVTGSRRWAVQRSVPPLTLRSAPGIAIYGPNIYVAMPGGKLLALAAGNGGVRWEAVVGDPRGATELERIADVSGMPAISGRDICTVSYQGRLGCLDAVSGAGRWAKDFSSAVGVAVDERAVYAADERGVIGAFSRDSGSSIWRNNKLANRGLSAPAVLGRSVAVGDAQGYVHFLSREDGSFIGRTETDGSRIIALVAAGGVLIAQTQSGGVFAIGGG